MTAKLAPTGAPSAPQISGRYLSLVTFKRDGTPVATPVWFVNDGHRLLVVTDAHSGKIKRIRHDPEVTVAPCRPDGRLIGPAVAARAEVLTGAEVERTKRLIARRYRLDRLLVLPVWALVQRLKGRRASGVAAAIALTARDP